MNVKKVIEAFRTLRDECDNEDCGTCPIRKACDNMDMYNLSIYADAYIGDIKNGSRSR